MDTTEVGTENPIAADLAQELGITVDEAKQRLKEQREREEQEEKEKHEQHQDLDGKNESNPDASKDSNKEQDAGHGNGEREASNSKEAKSEYSGHPEFDHGSAVPVESGSARTHSSTHFCRCSRRRDLARARRFSIAAVLRPRMVVISSAERPSM